MIKEIEKPWNKKKLCTTVLDRLNKILQIADRCYYAEPTNAKAIQEEINEIKSFLYDAPKITNDTKEAIEKAYNKKVKEVAEYVSRTLTAEDLRSIHNDCVDQVLKEQST